MLVTFIFVLVLFGVLSKSGLIPGEIVANIERRFFEDTISTQGHSEAWIGRSLIYESAYNDFVKRPILGSGFGHIMRIENIWAPDTWIDVSGTDNSFINIANKFGLLGLIIFFHFLYKIFSSLKSGLPFISKKDIVYFAAFTKAFPFLLLVALNIDVFYTYPEVIIFSVSAAKGLCMAGEKDMLNRVVAART